MHAHYARREHVFIVMIVMIVLLSLLAPAGAQAPTGSAAPLPVGPHEEQAQAAPRREEEPSHLTRPGPWPPLPFPLGTATPSEVCGACHRDAAHTADHCPCDGDVARPCRRGPVSHPCADR